MTPRLPLGIQTFEKLRTSGYLYLDKTELIHRLVSEGEYIFLARPRRFGKSLLLSTIEALFRGRRDLFRGLDIDSLNFDWTPREVIRLDLGAKEYNTDASLRDYLNELLIPLDAAEDDLAPLDPLSPERRLARIIRERHQRSGKRVVILIDEYDKPLLDALDNPRRLKAFLSLLGAFYSQMKSLDRHIRFAMLTGATKYGLNTLFAELNNFYDISADPDYQAICGITEEELRGPLAPAVENMAELDGLSFDTTVSNLKARYGGYRFAIDARPVMNPLSILSTLHSGRQADYWCASGVPEIIINSIKTSRFSLEALTHTAISPASLNVLFADKENPLPLLFQTGYLTLGKYSAATDTCLLQFPNLEVERTLLETLLPDYASCAATEARASIIRLSELLLENRIDDFLRAVQALIADTPYFIVQSADKERYYHTFFYLLTRLLGYSAHCEYVTLAGRIDMLVVTEKYIYIFEFKLDASETEAINQIERRGYAFPFADDPRRIIRVGVNFSSQTHTISSWKIES